MSTHATSNNPFSSAMLQRRAELRSRSDWLEVVRADPGARFVVASGPRQLALADANALVFLDAGHELVQRAPADRLSLLGWYQGAPCVLVDAELDETGLPTGMRLEETRPLLLQLSADEATIALVARGLQLWRPRHRFCGACGAATAPRQAGHSLRCTNPDCATSFFPRIDPAVIVVVSDGERVLLGRQAAWPPGRYSALAGFVEVGESLEDAVAREVLEETGIRCEQPRYFASQGWPFPASIMLGFHARARPAPLQFDGELEDARWFSAAELRATPSMLAPEHTIARRLINAWLQGAA